MTPLQLYRGQAGPDPAAAGLAHGELPERRRPHLPRGARQVGQERILSTPSFSFLMLPHLFFALLPKLVGTFNIISVDIFLNELDSNKYLQF